MSMSISKIVIAEVAKLAAPFVTLFYRKGIWNTPDNPDSPHGMYEQKMQGIHARFGTWIADWWWLGVRNRAYGLAYNLKPELFRNLSSYEHLQMYRHAIGRSVYTVIEGYTERVIQFKRFHVIIGYRLTPIWDEVMNNRNGAGIPFRPVNMDARPIFSIRAGEAD
jgi:hypothetical protein